MQIEYFGHSCFRLTADTGERLITDPYTQIGYELPKLLDADIVTISHQHFDHNYIDGVSKFSTVWKGQGDFTFHTIRGTSLVSYHDNENGRLRGKNLIFKLQIDGITVCHMGDIGENASEQLVREIGVVDILLLPIGGTYTIDAIAAKAYVDAINPKMVIPMHFATSDGTIDIANEREFLSLFTGNVQCATPKHCIRIHERELYDKQKQIVFMEKKA